MGKKKPKRGKKKPKRSNQKSRRRTTSRPRKPVAITTPEQVEELLGTPIFPIISGHAGLAALSRRERAERLRRCNTRSILHALIAIQSRLDVAATTDWTEGEVERQLLAEAESSWPSDLDEMVGHTHRLVPPRSMTQLLRETLELEYVACDAPAISTGDVLELIMSITTEQLAQGSPFDADPNPDSDEIQKLKDEIAAYSPEQTIRANREAALSELANLLSNAPVKLELIRAFTFDLWFGPWPDRVTDPRVGDSPASAFKLANKVDLLDVMVVGQIITERMLAGNFECSKQDLLDEGAIENAVEFVYANMSYSADEFRARLARDRSRGPVLDQRYIFTERPFLRTDDGHLSALRYQWAIDRFFGAQLYWQTFFGFGPPQSGSTAEAFSQAMNYAFERVVGDSLTEIASRSLKITRVVTEEEMQTAWTERRGEPPSVCDFVLVAGRACILFDATNHHLSANLAQGLASVDDFDEDVETAFVAKKFRQLVSTAKRLRDTLTFGVKANPAFYPFVVVPDNGLSSLTTVQFDWRERAAGPFEDLRGQTRAPVPISVSELALIEGLADHYSPGRDIADFIGGWLAQPVPMSLRQFVDSINCAAPIPTRMLRNQTDLVRMIHDRRNEGRSH